MFDTFDIVSLSFNIFTSNIYFVIKSFHEKLGERFDQEARTCKHFVECETFCSL